MVSTPGKKVLRVPARAVVGGLDALPANARLGKLAFNFGGEVHVNFAVTTLYARGGELGGYVLLHFKTASLDMRSQPSVKVCVRSCLQERTGRFAGQPLRHPAPPAVC